MTVTDLLDALTALQQPHAEVHLVGTVTCYEEHGGTYNDVKVRMEVVGVRSTHPKVVEVEGEES